jgi:dehydrogenase/reductase SDR family member 7B
LRKRGIIRNTMEFSDIGMLMKDMKGKTVWITGASSGIGEALAYEMARSGARLILSARRSSELERVRAACMSAKNHIIVPLDLEKYLGLENQITPVLKEHGPIDILINNAGISQRYLVAESSIDLDKKIMDINFLGTVAITRLILKNMLAHNKGQIVTVSSMLGLYGIQTRSAYSASKHALKGYFESLRHELFQTNIQITLVYPGYINTSISKNALLADGTHYNQMDSTHAQAMSVSRCAQKIIQAMNKKKAVVLISGFKERVGAVIAHFLPALFRNIAPRFKV